MPLLRNLPFSVEGPEGGGNVIFISNSKSFRLMFKQGNTVRGSFQLKQEGKGFLSPSLESKPLGFGHSAAPNECVTSSEVKNSSVRPSACIDQILVKD